MQSYCSYTSLWGPGPTGSCMGAGVAAKEMLLSMSEPSSIYYGHIAEVSNSSTIHDNTDTHSYLLFLRQTWIPVTSHLALYRRVSLQCRDGYVGWCCNTIIWNSMKFQFITCLCLEDSHSHLVFVQSLHKNSLPFIPDVGIMITYL